jgi:hypothetical protein
MARGLPRVKHEPNLAIRRSEAWTFTIPTNLVTLVRLQALPFSDEQLQILDEQTSPKKLN